MVQVLRVQERLAEIPGAPHVLLAARATLAQDLLMLALAEAAAATLARLPIFTGLPFEHVDSVVEAIHRIVAEHARSMELSKR